MIQSFLSCLRTLAKIHDGNFNRVHVGVIGPIFYEVTRVTHLIVLKHNLQLIIVNIVFIWIPAIHTNLKEKTNRSTQVPKMD